MEFKLHNNHSIEKYTWNRGQVTEANSEKLLVLYNLQTVMLVE